MQALKDRLAFIADLLRRTEPAPSRRDVEEALSPELLEEALKHAKLLFGEGVKVRDLLPGEVPSEIPELEDEPMKPAEKIEHSREPEESLS